jgi:hypothetical protein
VGYQALYVNTGANNTTVGYQAGSSLTTGTQNTLLGAGSQASAVGVSNEIVLGYNSVGNGAVSVTFGIGSGTETYIGIGNTSWIGSSDERLKENITASTAGLSFINALRPRTFKYRTLGELPETFRAYEADSTEVFKNSDTNHGFIAQEVKAAIDADDSIKDGFKLW